MESREKYTDSVHKLGQVTNSIAVLLMLAVPIIIMIVFNTGFNFPMFLELGGPLIAVYMVVCVTEVLAYTPILGATGAYLSFITGNISNMKIPAAVSAQNQLNAEKGTEEAEVASTIAIATSSIVTVTILTIGLVGMNFIAPILQNPVLSPGFSNVLPAIMGAFATPIILANPKKAVFPVLTLIFLTYIAPSILPASIMARLPMFTMPLVIVVSLILSFIYFKVTNKK